MSGCGDRGGLPDSQQKGLPFLELSPVPGTALVTAEALLLLILTRQALPFAHFTDVITEAQREGSCL